MRGWQEAAAILRLAGVVACMGTGGGVQVSDHFRAILGCLLSETWTTPTLVELVSTPDGHLLGRCAGEAASRVFPGGNSTFIAARISRFEVTRVAVPRCCRSLHSLGTALDKHAAEIWIFDAGALNLGYADSIPRKVLLSRGPPDRLCEAARAFFIEAPHDWRPHPSANLAHASSDAGTLRLCRLRLSRNPDYTESGGPPP